MDWSAGFSWWSSLRRERGPGPNDTDRADMGTAFGLDASFDNLDLPTASADASPPAIATPWESRLVRRSGL